MMQVQDLDERGLGVLRESILTLATTEGLPGHAASVRVRFTDAEEEAQS